jgi:hypothetical protein
MSLNKLIKAALAVSVTTTAPSGWCSAGRDVMNNPTRWKHLEHAYVLAEPVFLAQWIDTGDYGLIYPGASMVATSIEDFEQHPNSWWETESYLKRFGHPSIKVLRLPIIGVVPKGTIVEVQRLTQRRCDLGPYVKVWARICDGCYSGYEVLLNDLMKNDAGADLQTIAKPEYLLPLDCRA